MDSLFTPIQSASDPKYLCVRDDTRFREQRLFLENLWHTFLPFADPDFKYRFSTDFHSRFWEMYLACTLIEMGFDLIPRKTTYGPDIQIRLDNRRLWIEATAPGAGTGKDAVPGYPGPSESVEWMIIPEEQIILRLTNSFDTKCKEYEKYVSSGLVSSDDACVIAVNGFDIPHVLDNEEIPCMVKSVFGIGDLAVSLDMKNMQPVGQRYLPRKHIQKKSGSTVLTTRFPPFVSGILYSDAGPLTPPIPLGSEFVFIHNPRATQELGKGWICEGRSFWVENNQLRARRNSERV